MWAKSGKLVSVKEVSSFDNFWKIWHDVPRDAERAVHFRIRTHGETNQANCHPFFPAENIGLMHNGVIDCNIVDKKMSDTHNFAEYELKPLLKAYKELGKHPFDDAAWLDLVADLGGGSRLLFMDNAGNTIKTTEKSWVDRYGCLFSNGHSLTARYSSNSSRGTSSSTDSRFSDYGGDGRRPYDTDYERWPYEDDQDYNPHAASTVQVHDNSKSVVSGAVNSDTTKDADWREGRPANAYKDLKDTKEVSGPISDLYAGNKTDEEGQAALAEIAQARQDERDTEDARTEGMADDELTKAVNSALRKLTPAHPTDDDIEDEDTGLEDMNLILEIEDVLVLDSDKLYEFVTDYPASASCTIRALADTCIQAGITALTYPLSEAVQEEVKRAEG